MPRTAFELVRHWMTWGTQTLRRYPSDLLVIAVFGGATSSLLLLLPWVGEPLAVLWGTICDVVLLLGIRDAGNGHRPSLKLFRVIFRDLPLRGDLITLGAVCAFLRALVMLCLDWGVLSHVSPQFMDTLRAGDALPLGALPWAGMGLFLFASLLYFMATVFAGVMVADGGLKPFKALFYSFFLCVKKARPLFLAVLLIATVSFVLSAFSAILAVMTTGTVLLLLAPLVSVVVSLVSAAMMWRAYQMLFGEKHHAPVPPYPEN